MRDALGIRALKVVSRKTGDPGTTAAIFTSTGRNQNDRDRNPALLRGLNYGKNSYGWSRENVDDLFSCVSIYDAANRRAKDQPGNGTPGSLSPCEVRNATPLKLAFGVPTDKEFVKGWRSAQVMTIMGVFKNRIIHG